MNNVNDLRNAIIGNEIPENKNPNKVVNIKQVIYLKNY